jgi:uncharacterized membrane protein
MKLEKKLAQWQQAGLIDADTASRIAEHEAGQSRPVVLYAVGGVGAVAIVLGIVAIIASNWASISPGTKLSIDVLAAVGLAIAILRSSPGWVREILVIVNYGFVLASMALIGQIYHLDSGTWRGLLAWSVATAPMMLMARGRFAASLWVVGLVVTHGFVLFEWVVWLDDSVDLNEGTLLNVAIVTTGIGPLLYLLVARIGGPLRERPATASVFRAAGWLGVAVLALLAATIFYVSIGGRERVLIAPLVLLAAYGSFAAVLPRFEDLLSARALLGMRVLLVAGPGLGFLAVAGQRGDWPLVAAVLQIVVVGWMAWTALQIGHEGLFRLGVAAVCLRLLGIYIEVFGSMLETGLGLIVGGMLTIALAWFWVRKSRGLAIALADTDSASNGAGGASS